LLAGRDLAELNLLLPAWNSTEYEKRLGAQRRGELVQVVAWGGDRPVGKAMLLFPGHDEYSESALKEGSAEVRDVAVVEGARRGGIGSALVRALERAANEQGFARVGMSVAIGEGAGPGELVYAKLGYVRAHGPYITSTNLWDDHGRAIPVGGVMAYLVKEL
jgi:GNAT superfamily N-acetyltransferase